jgi:hypothetical protein
MNAVVKPSLIDEAVHYLHAASLPQALATYEALLRDPKVRDDQIADLGKRDRFFLLTHILHRPDAIHPWLYDRCRELEAAPDGYIDLWARDHYKSTEITFAGGIQEILKDPEITIGIFSHTKTIAKKFSGQIKRELEQNTYLKQLYPDVLYQNPERQSARWSEEAFIVRRKSNPAEATVEAWGLVDGQPIGKHWVLMIYDDVVTQESVQTADQIAKTTNAWGLSLNLADTRRQRTWYIGTRYDIADTYREIMSRGAAKPRIYPATDNGQPNGKPVFMTQAQLEKKKLQGSKNFACQMLQNPAAGNNAEFSLKSFRQYEIRPTTLNVYILGDYAGSRRSGSNRSAIMVIGMDSASNFYLLDGVCHRLKLSERWKWLKYYHRKWSSQPGIQAVRVGYERYGAQSDIEYFNEIMLIEKYSFLIEELNTPREGEISKNNRIRRMQPKHDSGAWYYPFQPCLKLTEVAAEQWEWTWHPDNAGIKTRTQREAIARGQDYLVALEIRHTDEAGAIYNLIKWYLETEYLFFPTSKDKDMLDAESRVYDLQPSPPMVYNDADIYPTTPEE